MLVCLTCMRPWICSSASHRPEWGHRPAISELGRQRKGDKVGRENEGKGRMKRGEEGYEEEQKRKIW